MTAIPPAGRDAPPPNLTFCEGEQHWYPTDIKLGGIKDGTKCLCGKRTHHTMLGRPAADAPEPRPKPLRCPRCGSTLIEGAYATWWCPTEACRDDAAAPRPAGPTPEPSVMDSYLSAQDEEFIETLRQRIRNGVTSFSKNDTLWLLDIIIRLLAARTALASARAALDETKAALARTSIVGIYTEFTSPDDAIGQMGQHIKELDAEATALQAALSEATRREEAKDASLFATFLSARGVDEPCERCGGFGTRTYGDTATWRGGIGGQALTSDVCDVCWGSGDKYRHWPNRRAALPEETRHGTE